MTIADDPHDLNRFVSAQEESYAEALAELRRGEKDSHWMWYIFPQYQGLGLSSTSRKYAVKSVEEAKAYLAHPILGPRLLECAAVTLMTEGKSAGEIFGSIDELKLWSSATLFAAVSQPGSVFDQLLDKYFGGDRDGKTLNLIAAG